MLYAQVAKQIHLSARFENLIKAAIRRFANQLIC